MSSFSLGFWTIQQSEFVGTKRKVVLRGEGNTWTPVLRSFNKLREVGDLSYLSFTLYLSAFMMFELIEVVSGRLIGHKSWNRNCINCATNCIVICIGPEMDVKFGFTK